jgi:FMN phosphatase YigB (HAD superfamily)
MAEQGQEAQRYQLRAVLFDIDNTLLDWSQRAPLGDHRLEHLTRVYRYVVEQVYPIDVEQEEFLAVALGLLEQLWQDGKRGIGAPHIGRALTGTLQTLGVPPDRIHVDDLMRAYDWQAVTGITVFPDVPAVMPTLHAAGLKTGLVTNSSHPMWMRDVELNTLGLLALFPDCRFSAADVGCLKPYPAIFGTALNCLGFRAGEVVFVGDEPLADIVGAHSVGMRAILRARAGESNMLLEPSANPDGTIYSFYDLLPLLDQWYPTWRSAPITDGKLR